MCVLYIYVCILIFVLLWGGCLTAVSSCVSRLLPVAFWLLLVAFRLFPVAFRWCVPLFSAHFLRVCTCATRKNNKKMKIVSGLKGFFKKSHFIARKSCFTAKFSAKLTARFTARFTAKFTTECIAKSTTNLLPSSQQAHGQADANTKRHVTAFFST